MAEGIIFKALSGFYYVESAGETYACRARGKLRLADDTPLVGDRVEFNVTEQGKGVVLSVLPRRNAFIRPSVANIDTMVIIVSAAIPVTDPYLIDRMTAVCAKNGCESIICINKYDLDSADALYGIYCGAGFKTVRTSAETGEGIDELLDALSGKLCAFTGNSGVGKSSILNMLDSRLDISVGDVSRRLGRGRHTTRHVELYKLPGGVMAADTPGFSSFDEELVDAIPKKDLQYVFSDFAPYLGACRFRDCAHIKEPGCRVLGAVQNGDLQRSRHASYVRMYNQAALVKDWERN